MNSECQSHFKNLNIYASMTALVASLAMTVLCFMNLGPNHSCILLILGIACSDFIYSLSNVISLLNNNETICSIEAIIREWSFNFSLIFVVALSILCYRASQGLGPSQIKYFRNVLVYGFFICLALSIQTLLFPEYVTVVNTGLSCFVSANKNLSYSQQVLVRAIYEGLPNSTGLAIAMICYLRSYNVLDIRNVRRRKERGYIFVMCLIVLPGLVDNFFRIGKDCEQSWLLAMHLVLTHSAGTLNAIAYGFHQYIRMRERHRRLLLGP